MVIRALAAAAAALLAPAPDGIRSGVSIPDLVQITDLTGLSISPDGRLLAFRTEQASIADNTHHLTWYVMPVDGSRAPRPIGDGGGPLLTDSGIIDPQQPIWAPSSRALYYRALIDGQIQVWRAPVDGSGASQLTRDPSNIRDVQPSGDGRALTYHVGPTRAELDDAERRADDEGVLIDKSVDVALPLSRGWFFDGKPASARFDGKWFERVALLADRPLRSVTLPIPVGDQVPQPTVRRPSPGTADIAWVGAQKLLRVTLPDGRLSTCQIAACRTGHPLAAKPLDEGQGWLVTTIDPNQRETLSLWEPRTGRGRRLVQSEGILAGDRMNTTIPCATGGDAIICVASDLTRPPHLVRVDAKSGAIHDLFDPNAGLAARMHVRGRELQWTDASGQDFAGHLLLPASPPPSGGYPLVINYYNCEGFLRGGVGDEQPMIPLAESGIASLCIEQLHVPKGVTANWQYEKAIAGIGAIIDRLSREGLVDRRRVGMAGLSFGSQVVTSVMKSTHWLRAAAISSAQAEPWYYWVNSLPGRDFKKGALEFLGLGDPERDPAGWKLRSPALNIASIQTPLLMQLPENEMRMSMEFYSKLVNSPTPVEMFGYAGESHIKHQPRHQAIVYERNLDWFRFWLQGVEDPDPAKADQYARWRTYSARPGYALPTIDRAGP